MSVANVTKAIQGVMANDQATGVADIEDLLTDGVWTFSNVVDSAAGTDFTYWAIKVPWAVKILDVTICPGGALTGADATANTYTLAKADGAGGSATAIGTHVTNLAGGNWVADVYEAFTLTASAANVTEGQILTVKKTHAGAGTATPQSSWTIRYRKI